MPSFGQVQLPDINTFADMYASSRGSNDATAGQLKNQLMQDTYGDQVNLSHEDLQKAQLFNQTSQQNLTDRYTLRGLAPGLATRDPNAVAGAVVLPNGGTQAVTALSSADTAQAERDLARRKFYEGVPDFSGGAPGGAVPGAPGQGASGPGGQQGAASGDAVPGLSTRESGNDPTAVNAAGYSGMFQHGTARLADIGLYTPAQGESLKSNQWRGTLNIPGFPEVKTQADYLKSPGAQRAAMAAEVANTDQAIAATPGADKLNPNGLRAVAHLGGVAGMQRFVSSGGLYDPADSNGTRLSTYYKQFAQGGVPALQQAFGHPDGHPGNQQQAAAPGVTGAPARGVQYATRGPMPGDTMSDAVPGGAIGPLPSPAGSPASGDNGPGFDANGQPLPAGTWDASPVRPGTQGPGAPAVAAGHTGPLAVVGPGDNRPPSLAEQQAFAHQNSPPPPAPAAPGTEGVDDVMARLRAQQVAAAGHTGPLAGVAPDGPLPAAPQNGIAPTAQATPVAQPQTAPVAQPQLMPAASAQPPAGAVQPTAQPAAQPTGQGSGVGLPPPGAVLGKNRETGLPFTAGAAPGNAWYRMPDGSVQQFRDPSQPQALTSKDSGSERRWYTPTGALDHVETIPDKDRQTLVEVPGGHQMYQDGKPVPGAPIIPYSGRPEQVDAYKSDLPKAEALTSAAQSAQASMPRLNEMAELATQLATGPTAELRAKGAAMLEAAGASPERIKAWTGMSSGSQAQEFVKLAIATAGSSAKADVGSNNGIQSTLLYQAANPNMTLLPDANKRITNMMRVSAQQIQDYAQGALEHFGKNEADLHAGKTYAPLTTFNRQWLAQSNPQIGAATMGILNGDPFEKWSAKISPAEGAKAAAMAARIDPTIMVPMKGGGMRPVKDILAHPAVAQPQPAAQPGAN